MFLSSCVTNPVNQYNISAETKPLGIERGMIYGLVPGLTQFLSGEYAEGIIYSAAFLGGIVGMTLSSETAEGTEPNATNFVAKPGYEAVFFLSLTDIVTCMLSSFIDALVTTWVRSGQYEQIITDPHKLRENLEISKIEIDPIYAALYRSYSEYPIGRVLIENKGLQDIHDVRVSLEVKDLTAKSEQNAFLDILPGKSIADLELTANLSDRTATITESTPVSGEITFQYNLFDSAISKSQTVTFQILGRNSFRWDQPEKIVAFVTSADEFISAYARDVLDLYSVELDSSSNSVLARAALLYSALSADGYGFYRDPVTPFAEAVVDPDMLDSIQCPRETLIIKTGDADELSLLYASLLESIGIRTSLISMAHDLLVAIDTGSNVEANWVPVDMRKIGQPFFIAVDSARRIALEQEGEDKFIFIDIRQEWEKFPPAFLDEYQINMPVPKKEALELLYADCIRRIEEGTIPSLKIER